MPTKPKFCEVIHCKNTNKNYDGPLFRFPKDPSRLHKWLENLGPLKTNNKAKYVCWNHFRPESFTDTFRRRLNKFAVPDKQYDFQNSISVDDLESSSCIEGSVDSISINDQENSSCDEDSADSICIDDSVDDSSLAVKQDADLLEKSRKIFPSSDKESLVQELPFPIDDILKHYVKKPTETVNKSKKGIPVAALYLPKYAKRKVPVEQGAVQVKKQKFESRVIKKSKNILQDPRTVDEGESDSQELKIVNEDEICLEESRIGHEDENSLQESNKESSLKLKIMIEDENSIKNNIDIESSTVSSELNFDSLLENLNVIEKPSHWWSLSSTRKYVICMEWNEQYRSDKRVIIKQDLEVKVFLKDSEVELPNMRKINSLNDVTLLLQAVDDLILCPGIQQVAPQKKCLLYLPNGNSPSHGVSSLCKECSNLKR